MLTPEPEAELAPELANAVRKLIRTELQLAVRAIVDDGLEPLLNVVAEMDAKHAALLDTLTESAGAIVDSQRRIEAAQARIEETLATFRVEDSDEPWRQSLEDVELDDSDD